MHHATKASPYQYGSFPETAEKFFEEFNTLRKRFNNMKPELEVTVRDPEHDIEGFVVVWNTKICKGGPFDRNGKGIGKGGTRILEGLHLEDIGRLAKSMCEKNAAAGLPLGGAKSGLNFNADHPDYEEKYRRFVRLVKDSGILAEDGGVFGGFGYDVGGRPPYNAKWACDELGSFKSFTGKPVEDGGTDYDKQGIAGLGVAAAAKTLLEHKRLEIQKSTFAVQGTGAMGTAVIKHFSDYGGQLKALSDPRYDGTWIFNKLASAKIIDALFNQKTKDVQALLKKEATHLSADSGDVLFEDVDVVFPCAIEDVISVENVEKIKTKFVCEGANDPTTDVAHDILFRKGIIVIPDIIANPGGGIAAYVELVSEYEEDKENLVQKAKDKTIQKVQRNVSDLLNAVDRLDVRPDLVADYMAYRNIFYGIPDDLS